MEECELCGRKTTRIYNVNIDGTLLGVCSKCASGKSVISERGQNRQQRSGPTRQINPEKQEETIVEGYGELIKSSRTRMSLPMKVVAERLNEKESYLDRIEEQKTLPTIALAKKLEKFFGIRIISTGIDNDTNNTAPTQKKENASLGEFAER